MGKRVSPLFDLNGSVALVTGGGSGLGREFCDVLAEFGADVICVARHKANVEETCEIIKRHGRKVLPIEADLSKYDQVQVVFKAVEDNFGKLDILVNNAGVIPHSAPIDRMDVSEWHRVIDINLHSVFYCMKEGLRMMLKKKKGSIINIASVVGLNAIYPDISTQSPYAASKAAIIGLTKQGAVEYGEYGIRVNCICPGWHLGTNLGKNAGIVRNENEAKAFRQLLTSRTPMKRVAEPWEIKGMCLFLASDASSFTTGQIIASDGGWTTW